MKRKEKMVGFILGIITGAAVILSLGGLYLAKKDAAAVSIIGGADGPTGALYLGKVTVCKNAVSIKPPRYGY